MSKENRFELFGLSFVKWTMRETIEQLSQRINSSEQLTHVITGNPIMVMAAIHNENYLRALQSADIIVPDGAGIVWAANQLNQPLPERVAGFDLMHQLLKRGETENWRVFLLGTDAATITEAQSRLRAQFPKIQWVGTRDGFFGAEQDEQVLEQIAHAKPDLLFVARSAALQEPWIAKHREKLRVKLVMGVGGSFDVISGKLKRAPELWIKFRLEWLYRLIQEPWRFKRMLDLPKFMWEVRKLKRRITKV